MLRESTGHAAVLAQSAAYRRHLPAAWTAATPAERNGLARAVFQQVEITDDRVTAVIPTADFAPFFNLAVANTETGLTALAAPDCQLDVLRGGSDGLRSHDRTTATGVVLVGLPPTRRAVGRSGRAPYSTQRPRQLADEERKAIRSLARTKSLRALAAEFGVSHETVRRVIREVEAAVA